MFLLNVGGTAKGRDMPSRYKDYDHMILDIVDGDGVDIVGDARELWARKQYYHMFDVVYCAHMLEHVESWEVHSVVVGTYNVLTPTGFVEFRTPNIQTCAEELVKNGGDIHALAYETHGLKVTIHDLLYGFPGHIVGNPHQKHRTGFTAKSLGEAIGMCFPHVAVGIGKWELRAFGFKEKPLNHSLTDLFVPDIAP